MNALYESTFLDGRAWTILVRILERCDNPDAHAYLVVPDGRANTWCMNVGMGIAAPDGSETCWDDPAAYYGTREEAEEALCLYRLKAMNSDLFSGSSNKGDPSANNLMK